MLDLCITIQYNMYVIVLYRKKNYIFMLSTHSLNGIQDEACVALGEALEVNMTLQTLR